MAPFFPDTVYWEQSFASVDQSYESVFQITLQYNVIILSSYYCYAVTVDISYIVFVVIGSVY